MMKRSLLCMSITLKLCAILILLPSVKGSCGSPGWFGDRCEFECHCKGGKDNCMQNGTCTEGCDAEWMGDMCQHAVMVSYDGYNVREKNGILTCNNYTKAIKKITISDGTPMSWMRVWTNVNAFDVRKGLIVMINGFYVPCGNPRYESKGAFVIDLHCRRSNDKVKEVTLKGAIVKNICRVHISGGRNLALKQNGTHSPDIPLQKGKTIDPVVDGDLTTCIKTKGTFTLHLAGHTDVFKVAAYFGKDYNSRQSGNFLKIYRNGGEIYKRRGTRSNPTSEIAVPNENLREATLITLRSPGVQLSLCELMVFGECPVNHVGSWCERHARPMIPWILCSEEGCANTGCRFGFKGKLCNIPCEIGYYGNMCRGRCSPRCNGTACNANDGTCPIGCIRGGVGPFCKLPYDTVEVNEGGMASTFLITCLVVFLFAVVVTQGGRLRDRFYQGEEDGVVGVSAAKVSEKEKTTEVEEENADY